MLLVMMMVVVVVVVVVVCVYIYKILTKCVVYYLCKKHKTMKLHTREVWGRQKEEGGL